MLCLKTIFPGEILLSLLVSLASLLLLPCPSWQASDFGEEQPLVGTGGSGTIFLTNCNLDCVYCQNYDISYLGYGKKISEDDLADSILNLQSIGCHNINFITPTHFTPQIVKAVRTASEKGLNIPVVYNCGGYESMDIIKLLNGIVDIYMPDIKYSSNDYAAEFSGSPDYFERCREALKEMHRQVGDLKTENGIAMRGMIIRHLILPEGLAGSEEVMNFISRELSRDSYINIMGRYHPAYNAKQYNNVLCYSKLGRRPTLQEMDKAINLAKRCGLHRGF